MCHSALARTIAAAAAAAVVDLPKPSDRQAARRGCNHQQQPPDQHQAVEHPHEAIVAFPIGTPVPEKNETCSDEDNVTFGTYQSTRIAPQDIRAVMTGDRLADAFEALEAACTWNSSVFASHAAIDKMHAPPAAEPLSTFHSGRVPALTLCELARVMQQSTKCEDAQLWMALVLFVRACATGDVVVPSCHSMHRLYVASLHVAMKVHSDRFLSNGYYAMLAGVSSAEMNQLEAALVQAAGWHLLVTSDDIAAVALSPPDYVKGLRRADVVTATRGATPAAKRPAAAVATKKANSPGSRGSVFLMTTEGCSPQSNVNNNTMTELSSNASSAFASYCCTPPGTPAFCGAAASPLTSAASSSTHRRNARHEDALDAAGLK